MFGFLLRWFGRRKNALARIRRAAQEHVSFESAHVATMHARLDHNKHANDLARSVWLATDKPPMIRKLGQYDRDQRVQRILGEVTRSYWLEGRKAPRYLRSLVQQEVPL